MTSEFFDEDEGVHRPRPLGNMQVIGFMWRHWMVDKPRFFTAAALFLAGTACDLSIPWAAGALVDAVSSPERLTEAAWTAWAFLTGLYVVYYGVRTIGFRILNGFYARIMEQIVTQGFERVQSYSADWHGSNYAGATVRKVSRAMWGYDSASDALLLMLMPTLIVLAGLAVSMTVRWPLAGLFTATIVIIFALYNVLAATYYVRPVNLISNGLDSQIGASLADAIGANPTVKAFGAEARESQRFARTVADWRVAVIRTWNRFNLVGLGQNVLLVILQGGLTGLILWAWTQGEATAGDVAFAITSFMLMAGYMRNFSEITRMLQKGLDDMLDVAVYMRTEPQLADQPAAPPFQGLEGAVTFDRVSFGYASQGERLYQDFSLAIAPGERIALVGPTGSGKSTFVKLLQRLHDLDGGRILIDGQDIAQVTQGSLRRAIAVVPQDPSLFHRSVGENIAYARPGASPEDVALAARRARAHDFIARLPQGYDTLVGERGVKLSGGERQRVAIARAFLADAPILVLDEATSSLDVETERQVQAATEDLMTGRTTIVIAHRLSTIRGADRILVFERGTIIEEGRHGDLLARGGAYARLHAVAEAAE